jgi:hypothetical protein
MAAQSRGHGTGVLVVDVCLRGGLVGRGGRGGVGPRGGRGGGGTGDRRPLSEEPIEGIHHGVQLLCAVARRLRFEQTGLAEVEEAADGGAIGVGQTLDVLGRGVIVKQVLQELLGQELGQSGVDIRIRGEVESGQMEHGGLGTEAAGVAVESVETDAEVVEPEMLVDAFVGGWRAIDEGAVELLAEAGRDLVEDGGIGFEGLGVGERFLRTHRILLECKRPQTINTQSAIGEQLLSNRSPAAGTDGFSRRPSRRCTCLAIGTPIRTATVRARLVGTLSSVGRSLTVAVRIMAPSQNRRPTFLGTGSGPTSRWRLQRLRVQTAANLRRRSIRS